MLPVPNYPNEQPDFGADPSMQLQGNVNLMPIPRQKRGGMFGSPAVRGIAGSIGDYLLQMSKMQPIYAPAAEQQRRMAYAQQQYQQQRQDGLQDYITKETWERAHPAPQQPTEFERMAAAAGIAPGTPEFQALAKQFVQNKANPFVQMRTQNADGSESLQFMRPPMTPTAPVGNLIPIDDEGGPASQAPDGFR